jgi:hypothetical protein
MNPLLARLLGRVYRDPEPGSDGGGPILNDSIFAGIEGGDSSTAAPAEPSASTAAPAPAATPAAPAVDPMAGAKAAIDAIGKPEPSATPTPSPAPAPGEPVARDPSGKFLPKDPATPPTPSPAPAAPTPSPSPAPAADDLTPPEGLSERSQARWQALTSRVKDTEAQAGQVRESLDAVRTLVRESGLQANEFTDMLAMARGFKSNDPAQMQSALQQLEGLRADLAHRMGVEVPGVDLLAKHADLRADVDNLVVSRERAVEIARLRDAQARSDAATQAQRTQEQEQQRHTQALQSASVAMDTTLSKHAGEPGHQQRMNAIGQYFKDPAKLQAFVTTYTPDQWAHAVDFMYTNIALPQAAAAPTPVPPQALRPSNVRASAAGQPQGPLTAGAAVSSALDALGI